MLIPDLPLTQRLERHEAWSSAAHAAMQARLYPATGAAVEWLGTGCAVYCGSRSPINGVYGWGLQPVTAEELGRVETFYRSRNLPARVRLHPLADPSLLHLLGERSYAVESFMNVYACPLQSPGTLPDAPPAPVPGVTIRVADEAEARQWFTRSGAGGDWAEPDGVSFMAVRCTLKAGTQLFVAWSDGEPVGAGALETNAGVAALMAASTLPAWRGRGIHSALLRARLAAASAAGCDVAMVHTRPGATSQRNVLRAGFPLLYTTVTLVSR